MKRIFGFLILVAIFLVALALGSQNVQLVQFNYLIAQAEFSLAMLLGAALTVGFVLGAALFFILFLKLKLQNAALNRSVRQQTQELNQLKAVSVKE